MLGGHHCVRPAVHFVHVRQVVGPGQERVDRGHRGVGRQLVVALPVRQHLQQDTFMTHEDGSSLSLSLQYLWHIPELKGLTALLSGWQQGFIFPDYSLNYFFFTDFPDLKTEVLPEKYRKFLLRKLKFWLQR